VIFLSKSVSQFDACKEIEIGLTEGIAGTLGVAVTLQSSIRIVQARSYQYVGGHAGIQYQIEFSIQDYISGFQRNAQVLQSI